MVRKSKKMKHADARKGLGQMEKKFIHLKEFSQGRPNELSLNVLEQKAASLDEPPRGIRAWFKRDKPSSAPQSGSLPAQTSGIKGSDKAATQAHGAGTGAKKSVFLGADSQAEIALRQKRRRRYRRFSIALVALICVGIVGTGGYWFYQEQVRLSTSVGVLHEACDIIQESDKTTIAIDEFFRASFNDDTLTTATQLKDSIPQVREDLASARTYAQKAESELDGSQRDKEAAQRVLSTIASRETLLDVAEKRLADDIAAKQAIDDLDQAQQAIDSGNALLVQAARVVSDTTEENVAESTEYTTSAKAEFEEARGLIQDAQAQYPSADLSAVLEYVNKKSQEAGEALASNAAILIQDKATAEAHNDAYNQADTEATALAEQLPAKIVEILTQAYVTNQESLIADYDKARSDAATHDAFLRDYLGTSQ